MARSTTGVTRISTEKPNDKSANLSNMSTIEIMSIINEEDTRVPFTVRDALPDICAAAETVSHSINSGNRIFLVGAGTSGRIAAMDAAELPPTFGFSPRQFQAIIAGGNRALLRAVEGAEDNTKEAPERLKRKRLNESDVVIGITASGRTPFVLAALRFARKKGCRTIGVTSNTGSEIEGIACITIIVKTGSEVVAGSTRMKAGTAQKMVLNMISTYAGIRAGRVIGNRMVGMKPTNEKLRIRAVEIVSNVAGCTRQEARMRLEACDYDIASAISAGGKGSKKILAKRD